MRLRYHICIKPFNRLRVKVKEEIISLGYPELSNPNKKVGTYLNSTEFEQASRG